MTALKAERMKNGLLSGPVFSTRTGGYLAKKNVLRAFRCVVKKANAAMRKAAEGQTGEGDSKIIPEGIRFHDLRHSVASLLLSKGHSLRAVSQRLGHANPTMTLRVYAHCMPNDDAQLAEGLARLMA